MMKKILGVIAGLFLIVGLTQSRYAADLASDYDSSSNTVNVSTIYSKTRTNLMQAAEEMGHSIERRIKKIKIGATENTFISFVLSDTFPDKFKDGEIVGFVDVSGYGDKLPDGQYGVKFYFDEKNLNNPSEFINVTTGEQYFFDTDMEKIEASDAVYASEFSIKSITDEECIWIDVYIPLPGGIIIHRRVCLNCPDCYN